MGSEHEHLDSLELARDARIRVLEMCARASAPHVASSLSCIDILAVLYAGKAGVQLPTGATRGDTVIVSKGHAAAGTYAVLAEAGYFPRDWLLEYCVDGSPLGGHVMSAVPGVELSTGSLGHGLPFGTGVALANKLDGKPTSVYVVMSDGECDEGSTWEAGLFAAHHKLGGLIAIIDRNGIQSLGGTEETLQLEPLAEKWQAFGWHVLEIDGHDHQELASALNICRRESSKPSVVICQTVKGKGVSFMENEVVWHYRPPTFDQARDGIAEIKGRVAS